MDSSASSGSGARGASKPAPRAALRALLVGTSGDPDLSEAGLRDSLVAGLADEDAQLRSTCAWALTMLADEQPGAIAGVVKAITERFGAGIDGQRPPEERGHDLPKDARSVLSRLDDAHPGRVRPVLADAGIDAAQLSAGHAPRPAPVAADDGDDSSAIDDLRQVVSTSGEMPVVHVDENGLNAHSHDHRSRGRPQDDEQPAEEPPTHADDEPSPLDAGEPDAAPQESRADRAARRKREEIGRIQQSDTFQAIRELSRFDDMAVIQPRDGGRYADMIRVKAELDGDEQGLSLGLFEQPDSDREAYANALAERLARWQGAGRANGVVSIYDWAEEPRPWVAAEPVGETLAEWDAPGVEARLQVGANLADTVAVCHRQGVVHAGIDPGNVVFPADSMGDQPEPMLDNVGLMLAFRDYFEPAKYLDPRYAPPEYFDREYGGIDQSTDVYGLGAVLYHLLTGRAPFRGTYDDVRRGILEEDPTPPTELNASLPDPIDDVLSRALGKQKLVRYETASQLRTDLLGVCQRSGYKVR